jgi:hypothetical protein
LGGEKQAKGAKKEYAILTLLYQMKAAKNVPIVITLVKGAILGTVLIMLFVFTQMRRSVPQTMQLRPGILPGICVSIMT